MVNYLHSHDAAEATVDEIRRLGAKAAVAQADVSKPAEVDRLVCSTLDVFGAVNILVNNAGIYRYAPLDQLTEEKWDSILNTNLKGVYLCSQSVAKPMRAQGSGSIVNITSTAGMFASARSPAYSASKAGIIALTRSLAEWFAPNVKVNTIAAGWIEGGLSSGMAMGIKRKIELQTPLKRFGRAEEIANIVRFLVSEEHFMTGQVITADGGLGTINWFLWD
jgi:3-oxoacyl-[acyl-carrier protein] reductase